MGSLLPEQIIPPSEPIGTVAGSSVMITKNWWLLLYNIALNSIGTQGSLPDEALELLDATDSDVDASDTAALRRPLANALVQAMQPSDVVVSSNDLPDIARALLLAQDPLLPDPPALAQPVAGISPTGSPFTYTAPFAGTVVVTGGSVSGISVVRQGTPVATGITAGLIPVSRYDQVQVTYGSAPTMTFIPGSSA